jgi:diguanylate cyclase (GGDEF)-like protein/PAS domain S-box-containing protein
MIEQLPSPRLASRLSTPSVIVTLFVLVMSTFVVGLVIWKAIDARQTALAQSEIDVRNMTRSLMEHASHTMRSADVAISGMADLLRYQTPQTELFDRLLVDTTRALPEIREISVVDALGAWRFSSRAQTPGDDAINQDLFAYHRDHIDQALRINNPRKSDLTGRMTIPVSKRVNKADGSFNGVVIAAIDNDSFNNYYAKFQLGENAGISLIRTDGVLLTYWPIAEVGKDLSKTALFQTHLKQRDAGYYKIISPIDGLIKYFGYEQSSQYPLVVAVAIPEQEFLALWQAGLFSDIAVAAVLLCSVILLAALLSTQFRFRLSMENVLREREAHYRLLADNIADVVILLDRIGNFVFVSPSVRTVLGLDPRALIGKSCFELVHPDDVEAIKHASAQLTDRTAAQTAIFRTYRGDGSQAWVEINFKLASRADDREKIEVVGVLRDVTERKTMQDELTALNARLAQLATTDGLTGLANRRTLDGFLRREFQRCAQITVLLFDIDNFKGFNDNLGHQAGDECLKKVAALAALATTGTPALAARYGGEEFAIIMPNVSEADAMLVAEAVRLEVRALWIANPASANGYLSISIGVASRSPRSANDVALLGEADMALYEAKHRGRDCSVAASSLNSLTFDGPAALLG